MKVKYIKKSISLSTNTYKNICAKKVFTEETEHSLDNGLSVVIKVSRNNSLNNAIYSINVFDKQCNILGYNVGVLEFYNFSKTRIFELTKDYPNLYLKVYLGSEFTDRERLKDSVEDNLTEYIYINHLSDLIAHKNDLMINEIASEITMIDFKYPLHLLLGIVFMFVTSRKHFVFETNNKAYKLFLNKLFYYGYDLDLIKESEIIEVINNNPKKDNLEEVLMQLLALLKFGKDYYSKGNYLGSKYTNSNELCSKLLELCKTYINCYKTDSKLKIE